MHPSEQKAGDSVSQTNRVALRLREMLLRGQFRAGERLAELTIAAMLNASRTPVRLALERLAHEGMLEVLAAGGFRVRAFTIPEIWDAIEIRGVLEGTAARFAAERFESADESQQLDSCCRQMERMLPVTIDSFADYLEVNDAFHHEMWRLSKSPVLVRTLESASALPFAAPGALVFGTVESSATRCCRSHRARAPPRDRRGDPESGGRTG